MGSLEWVGLNNVGLELNADYAATIPHQAYMIFQAMFAIITPALITGAFAERKRFKAFIIFTLLWATFVYDPIAHWVWAVGGWLRVLGALDFAGGTVVHISSGVSALVAALVLGRRRGFGFEAMDPHDATMSVLGAALLWFGWFGFNAGSALGAGPLAVSAFVVTNTAAGMAALTWITVSWLHKGSPSVLGAAAGAVAGLVAITPAAGYVDPRAAVLIGFGAGIICYGAVQLKNRLRVDDALDVWGMHGVGGAWGALATGLFATTAINAAGADGLFFGNAAQVAKQLIAIGAVAAYAAIATWIILWSSSASHRSESRRRRRRWASTSASTRSTPIGCRRRHNGLPRSLCRLKGEPGRAESAELFQNARTQQTRKEKKPWRSQRSPHSPHWWSLGLRRPSEATAMETDRISAITDRTDQPELNHGLFHACQQAWNSPV